MNKPIKLLFVGRFDRQKGVDILLKIFSENSFPNIELILIGDGVLNERKIDIPFGVKHLGWIDSKNIEKYYESCDAVIMPSRWEGFSYVALEAIKNKKAIIASKVASLTEIVINEVTGILFELNDSEELCLILRSLDKKTLTAMGEEGYKYYKEHFTADSMNSNILLNYKRLLQLTS